MSENCVQCGAVLAEGNTCQTIFDECLMLEFANPAYGRVHFLTVSCFMVQHGRYSDEALAWIQPILRAYLDEQLTTQQIRRRAARGTNSAQRTWKVTRRPDAPPLPMIAWSITIADVAQSLSNPEAYCEKIKQWARATLQQMVFVPR